MGIARTHLSDESLRKLRDHPAADYRIRRLATKVLEERETERRLESWLEPTRKGRGLDMRRSRIS